MGFSFAINFGKFNVWNRFWAFEYCIRMFSLTSCTFLLIIPNLGCKWKLKGILLLCIPWEMPPVVLVLIADSLFCTKSRGCFRLMLNTVNIFVFWKVYTLSVSGDRLIVGTAGRRVLVWDLRNMGYVQQRRESSLKYQTRCIRAFPNKQVWQQWQQSHFCWVFFREMAVYFQV